MNEKPVSLLMIYILLFQSAGFAGAAPATNNKADIRRQAAGKNHVEKKENRDKNRNLKKRIINIICPFRFLIYFFWFSFAAIAGAVIFIADITTGTAFEFTRRFINWFRENTRAMFSFFESSGCSGTE